MSETSYPYAIGRIKVQEAGLIDKTRWNRLWEADEAEAMKLLEEIGYGSDAKDNSQLDNLIDAELTKTRNLIGEITPDKAITDMLLMPTDAHNIKTILKGQLQRVEVENLLLEGGGIAIETLVKALEHGDYTILPYCYREPLKRLEEADDPRLISITIDNAAYTQILKTLADKKHTDPLLRNYYRTKIDFTNILTILRANVLHWDIQTVKPLFITGGEIDERILVDSVGIPTDQLVKQLAHGEHSVIIRTILEHYAQNSILSEVEQKFENAAFDIIHDRRNDSFGIGPIANYLFLRQAEGKALRVMFAGKRSGKKIPLSELGAVI